MASHGLISEAQIANATVVCNGQFEPPPNQECADLVAAMTLQVYDINPSVSRDILALATCWAMLCSH
jgi:hypothetical protein